MITLDTITKKKNTGCNGKEMQCGNLEERFLRKVREAVQAERAELQEGATPPMGRHVLAPAWSFVYIEVRGHVMSTDAILIPQPLLSEKVEILHYFKIVHSMERRNNLH